jgi:hypothetical protein|tara:strand:- start:277 stop:798 length:522 start_codon:yes stop_codon:yes gene_type:complete
MDIMASKKQITEHTVNFTKEDMDLLHKDGKVVKSDPDGKDHTYTYTEPEQLSEGEKYSVIDPRGNVIGTGEKIQASAMVKKKGGNKKGYYVVQAKNGLKAKRALEKAKGNFSDGKFQDKMSDLYWEGTMNESDDNYRKALEKIARDKQLKMLSAKDKATLLKIAQMMKTANDN